MSDGSLDKLINIYEKMLSLGFRIQNLNSGFNQLIQS
jgi:hypothetical protein